ncbi:MAG: hypothetical protein LBD23_00820 [Oscillospiraceae bacterium]|jgi:hypothetical protein|nr:hypothetical protein [Oscillospiraceae bacterium]
MGKFQNYSIISKLEDGQYQKWDIELPETFFDDHITDGGSVSGDAKDMVQELSEHLKIPIKLVINQKVKDEMLDRIDSGFSYKEILKYGCFPQTPTEYISGHDRFRATEISEDDIRAKLQAIRELWNNFETSE